MANDDPLAGTPGTPTPAAAPAAPAAPATPAPAFVTADDLAKFGQALTASLGQHIRDAQPAPAAAPAAAPAGAPDDWNNQFFADPRDTIRKEVNEVTAGTVREFARAQSQVLLDQLRTNVERDYYPGVWGELFEGRLSKAVENSLKSNPLQVVNIDNLKVAVNSITGEHVDKLVTGRDAHRKATGEATAKERESIMEQVRRELPGLTGGVRLVSAGGEATLDQTGKDYINSVFAKTGSAPDEKELAVALTMGNSLSDFKKAQAQLKAGK